MTEVGHNNPPASEAFAMEIDELFATVSDTLEGIDAVQNDDQDAALDNIMDKIRRARKDAVAARKAEKEPHLEAGRAVDAAYKPTLGKADMAIDAIKALLTPYRTAKQRAKDEEARLAREAAEAAEKAAQAKLREPEHLQAKFDAEEELKQAAKLKAQANKIDRSATGLRTHWEAEVTDRKAALLFYIKRSPERFDALIQQMADEDARGSRGAVPGVIFHERKKAA